MLKKLILFIIVILILLVLIAMLFVFKPKIMKKYFYPIKYDEVVEVNSQKYDIDKYYIYAIIRTESDFDEEAESNVGARGLMQIMPDTYDWIKYRLSDERLHTFDNMYDADYNIEYGSFLLSYLYHKYNSYELAAAAYHAGTNQVDKWLKDQTISLDSKTIAEYPSSSTQHYVNKVMKAWENYKHLYSED